MTGPQKTLTDIWNEVQEEQRQFNKIVRYMITALIVAAIVAGAGALMSWFKLNNLSATYQQKINLAQAQASISRAASISSTQSVNSELLAIRQTLNEQRDLENSPRRIDQVIEDRRKGSGLPSFDQLRKKAVVYAKESARGSTLSNNDAYLIQKILEEYERLPDENVLSTDEALLLQGVIDFWATGVNDDVQKSLENIVRFANSEEIRGLGNSALAHFHYKRASQDPDNSLGWEVGCELAVDYSREAEILILKSPKTLLAKAECQRKGGYPFEAFESFADALETILIKDGSDSPSLELRMAVHGTGTTLVALKSEETRNESVTRNLPGMIDNLKSLPLPASSDEEPFFGDNPSDFDVARALLNYAADLRAARGEGEITRLYSTENIGFIYLLENDWSAAAKHAREIDDKLALAWNLTVLIIALEQQAEDRSLPRSDRAKYREEANFSRLKLSLMRRDQLDVSEIKKLLPADHAHEVDEIIRSISSGQQ